jgi:hypothetical protein
LTTIMDAYNPFHCSLRTLPSCSWTS